MNKQKEMYLLSQLVHESICQFKVKRLEKLQDMLIQFSNECHEITRESGRYNLAIEKKLLGATERMQARIGLNMNNFCHKANEFKQKFNADEGVISSVSVIHAELAQIEQEFGQFNYGLKEKVISVVTEPISFDYVSLGSFEIRLNLSEIIRLYSMSPYRIIALEPNPAGNDEDVTHPHVSQELLCEGDGHLPIRKALQEGRLCDFFMLIAQILNTYNPDSPYVSLDDWEGYSCYDCGYTVSRDESYYCENCDNDFCEQCSSYCKICDTTLCRGCLSECPDCEEPVCQGCFSTCGDCERMICKDCIDICVECNENFCMNCLDENGICSTCIDQRKEIEDEETIQTTSKQAIPAVQSDSVGQTRIPA